MFPILPRFAEDFSSSYLRYAIARTNLPERIVFLGDSVLWGYRLPYQSTTVGDLALDGFPVANFAYEGGSMCNTYAMLRVMLGLGYRPRRLIFNVNLKEFNPQDSAYNTLYPALASVASAYLTPGERRLLTNHGEAGSINGAIDELIAQHWSLYGMRVDIRQLLFHHVDAAHAAESLIGVLSGREARLTAAHQPTADRFLGTYDLTPLSETNVEVVFLRKTIALAKRWKIPTIVILTPTNHGLLHDYIDTQEYEDQLSYVRDIVRPSARILNYDKEFGSNDFFDNDHLRARGSARLSALIAAELAK